MAETKKVADAPPAIPPEVMRWSRARLVELLDRDLKGVRALLNRAGLTHHLVEHGRSASVHFGRLMQRQARVEDAEKEVTAQWVSVGDEVPDPLSDAELAELAPRVHEWAGGEGRIFFDGDRELSRRLKRFEPPPAAPPKK
jgi:hypothetical protein